MMIPKKGEAVLPHYKHTASQFYGWSCPTSEVIISRLGAPIKRRMEIQLWIAQKSKAESSPWRMSGRS